MYDLQLLERFWRNLPCIVADQVFQRPKHEREGRTELKQYVTLVEHI